MPSEPSAKFGDLTAFYGDGVLLRDPSRPVVEVTASPGVVIGLIGVDLTGRQPGWYRTADYEVVEIDEDNIDVDTLTDGTVPSVEASYQNRYRLSIDLAYLINAVTAQFPGVPPSVATHDPTQPPTASMAQQPLVWVPSADNEPALRIVEQLEDASPRALLPAGGSPHDAERTDAEREWAYLRSLQAAGLIQLASS